MNNLQSLLFSITNGWCGQFLQDLRRTIQMYKAERGCKSTTKNLSVPESTIRQTSLICFSLLDQRKNNTAEKNYSCEA